MLLKNIEIFIQNRFHDREELNILKKKLNKNSDLFNSLDYKKILPDGNNLGIKISYQEQSKPRGLPDAFVIGEKFIGKENVAMILGDNFFYGQNLSKLLLSSTKLKNGAKVILHKVVKPELFGVAKVNNRNKIIKQPYLFSYYSPQDPNKKKTFTKNSN